MKMHHLLTVQARRCACKYPTKGANAQLLMCPALLRKHNLKSIPAPLHSQTYEL